jgi:hypothetical protein
LPAPHAPLTSIRRTTTLEAYHVTKVSIVLVMVTERGTAPSASGVADAKRKGQPTT